MDKPAIKIDGVSKNFKLPREKYSSVKSAAINFYRRRLYETQEVLKDVSLEVKQGDFFGIVGRNGSGKSTLLKLLAGIYTPTSGHIEVSGKLTPFIELGVGFNPELTGRENVFLNGSLLGFNRKEMRAMYTDIVEFAELEKFMDQKLKNYSSGMQVRLAFSIAIRAKSDILLIDEVLAVGDAIFQKKCYDYFRELKRDKKTVVLVSHDTNVLREYCDEAILIDKGEVLSRGNINSVVNDYVDLINKTEEKSLEGDSQGTRKNKRWGEGSIRTESVEVYGSNLHQRNRVLTDTDKSFTVEVKYRVLKKVKSPIFGITINDAAGQSAFTSNTLWSKIKTKDVEKSDNVTVKWLIPNVFNTGSYSISPAAASEQGDITLDWLEAAAVFKVRKQLTSASYINAEHQLEVRYER